MVLFPNCKINLGLNIIRKRNDGFHDIETVFYPLKICDAVELVEIDNTEYRIQNTESKIQNTEYRIQNPVSSIHLTQSGLSIPSKPAENLCLKAHDLLKKDFPHLPAVKMHLHKAIPTGAGLGGGSADGAFTLKLLNQKFSLGLSTEKLIDYAAQLGSDCPFFIINKPCFATGRGEFLERIRLDLSAYKFIIVNPGIHIVTAEIFSMINPTVHSKSVNRTVEKPIESWKNELENGLEKPVFKKYPEIGNIKTQLYDGGAIYASMTGSGSTVYGLFEKNTAAEFSFPSNYLVRELIG